MSELINNSTQRKEKIKSVIQQLHEGKTVDEVKAEFADVIKDADAGAIADAEQLLINEGVPVEDIQMLCNVHSAVFRETLDRQQQPELLPGHPVHTFWAENQAVERLLSGLRQVVDAYKQSPSGVLLGKVRMLFEMLLEVDKHFLRKENLLFPYLEKYGFYGPSKVMWGIHNEIRASLKSYKDLLQSLLNASGAATAENMEADFAVLETAFREMFYKEEKILFPAALERLSDGDWKMILSQEASIGYCFVEPGNRWPPSDKGADMFPQPASVDLPAVRPGENASLIPLNVGQLSGEQINLMLKNLPVDVTFVDENDNVCYFSETRERIFQRSPAIIGRKVQNCHPPQSMNRVQQILDDFRSGQRDVAEFWIQMNGKFIHIRYFAVHDAVGVYRGTIEVSQDLSDLRNLQGEHRLLDEPMKPV